MYLIQFCPDLSVNAAAAVAGNPVAGEIAYGPTEVRPPHLSGTRTVSALRRVRVL